MEIIIFSNWHLGTEDVVSTENPATTVHRIGQRIAKFKFRKAQPSNKQTKEEQLGDNGQRMAEIQNVSRKERCHGS